jgi:hypothetical protein
MGTIWLVVGTYLVACIFFALLLILACIVGTRSDQAILLDDDQDQMALPAEPILIHESATFEILYPAK